MGARVAEWGNELILAGLNLIRYPDHRRLPVVIRRTLASPQFRLAPDEVSALRYLQMPGRFMGDRVQMLRIYDPAMLLGVNGTRVPRYDGLGGSPALRFEGRMYRDGKVFLRSVK